jgi:hypothetical protein
MGTSIWQIKLLLICRLGIFFFAESVVLYNDNILPAGKLNGMELLVAHYVDCLVNEEVSL